MSVVAGRLAGSRSDPIRVVRRATPSGRVRTFTILSRTEAAAWDELAGRVGAALERRLAEGVVANRVRFRSGGWSLEPVRDAHRRAEGLCLRWPGRALLTDVRDFYGSVSPGVVEGSCLAAGVHPADATLARELIEGWQRQGATGLPVGPRGSAVIANAVLLAVDRTLGSRPFLRWVDDYRIAVAGEEDAAAVLLRIDEALAMQGLHRAEAKTRLVGSAEPWPGAASLGSLRTTPAPG